MFALMFAFGASGLVAAVAAVVTALDSMHQTSKLAHHLTTFGLHFTYPAVNPSAGVLLGLAVLGSTVLTLAVRATWRQRRAYRSLLGRIAVVGSLSRHPAVSVIADPYPQAFCAGYLRPAVYVSERTVALLTTEQLTAVIAHERHHLRVRDPLRFAWGRILAGALFFVPILRSLSDRYGEVAEVKADGAAVAATAGHAAPLAAALLAFEAHTDPNVAGISPERVDSLLGEPDIWRVPRALTAVSIAALGAVGLLIGQTSAGANAHASLDLPVFSAQPCLAVLTLFGLAGVGAIWARSLRAESRRISSPRRSHSDPDRRSGHGLPFP